jgi:hypothetical protein
LTMPHIAGGFPPARRTATAISRGHIIETWYEPEAPEIHA